MIPAVPTPAPTRGMSQDAYNAAWEAFLAAFPAIVAAMNATASDLNNLVNAAFTTTSTTSLAIGTGNKSLTVEQNLGYSPGQSAVVASTVNPANRMAGVVTAYNSTTGALDIAVASVSGSGTFASWSVGLIPESVVSSFMASLLDDPDAATARATLGAEPQGEVYAFNTQTGSAYTLALSDKGKFIWMQPSTTQVLTIPPNSSVAFPIGTRIDLGQAAGAAGGCSISPGAGVTLASYNSNRKLQGVGAGACLVKTSTNQWWLFGQIIA